MLEGPILACPSEPAVRRVEQPLIGAHVEGIGVRWMEGDGRHLHGRDALDGDRGPGLPMVGAPVESQAGGRAPEQHGRIARRSPEDRETVRHWEPRPGGAAVEAPFHVARSRRADAPDDVEWVALRNLNVDGAEEEGRQGPNVRPGGPSVMASTGNHSARGVAHYVHVARARMRDTECGDNSTARHQRAAAHGAERLPRRPAVRGPSNHAGRQGRHVLPARVIEVHDQRTEIVGKSRDPRCRRRVVLQEGAEVPLRPGRPHV